MSQIKKKIETNYLFGCIKYNLAYNIYLMPIAYWILNYQKYDPTYNPKEWELVFRRNILNVKNNVRDFLRAIEVDKLEKDRLRSELGEIPKRLTNIYFFVDFDSKLFINSFPDIEVQEFLPDDDWTGIFDNPTNYLPGEIKAIFSS